MNEFLDISLSFKNNFKVSEFLNMNLEKFLLGIFSFIFTFNIKTKNLDKLLLYLEDKMYGNIILSVY